jgi:hypothetical protein
MQLKTLIDKRKTPWGGPRGKGGYYEKLMEVIFRLMSA